MVYKQYEHTPPHLFIDNALYFITGSTCLKNPLLIGNKAKDIFYEQLVKYVKNFDYRLMEWVVLNNHYHILIRIIDF